ncbi:MAG: hypothetical protein WAK31_10235 [Chthoniobacterales bacterium]
MVPLLLLCGFLSGCMLGWRSGVNVLRLEPLGRGEVIAVVSRLNGVSVDSLPPKGLPQGGNWRRINVRRGNVVALVSFPTPEARKYFYDISIDTSSRSAEGKTFVKDLADALQKKFGDPSVVPQVERIVNDGGP